MMVQQFHLYIVRMHIYLAAVWLQWLPIIAAVHNFV